MSTDPPPARTRRPLLSNLSPAARAALFVWACAFLLAAAVLGFFLGRELMARRSTGAWPGTTGTLTQADAVGEFSGGSRKYRIDVEYTYEVDGRPYRGTRLAAGETRFRDLRSAQNALRGLQPGGPVAVYYDPADPSRSLLRPASQAKLVLLLALPLLMAASGAALLLLLRRARVENGQPLS